MIKLNFSCRFVRLSAVYHLPLRLLRWRHAFSVVVSAVGGIANGECVVCGGMANGECVVSGGYSKW